MRPGLTLALAAALIAGAVAPLAGSTPAPGAKLWGARFNSGFNKDDSGEAVAFSPESSKVVVVGSSVGGTTKNDLMTIAYSATGARLWAQRYDGPAHGDDYGFVAEVSADRAYAIGTVDDGATTGQDFVVVAYSLATGAKLWAAKYTGPGAGFEILQDAALSADGTRLYVTGNSPGAGPDYYATVAYDTSTGKQLWANRYNPNGLDADPNGLALSPDGTKVFVTGGNHNSAGYTDMLTLALNASTGQRLWATRYDGPDKRDDAGADIGVSPDGTKVLLTGGSFGTATGWDYETLAYDAATGHKAWAARYDGPAHGIDSPTGLAVAGNRVFVTGNSDGGASFDDYETISYAVGTGHPDWKARYNGPGNNLDQPARHALVVNPSASEVFVTGYIFNATATQTDYATVAYNAATGGKLWGSRYDGPANASDFATAIATSRDGTKVAVTGYSYGGSPGSPTNFDFATLAYQP